VAFDDPIYVEGNPHVAGGLTPAALTWAFTTFHAGYWIPLTWVSYMIDVQVAGVGAGPHHVTNVLLHLVNTLLLFGWLRRITGATGRSACVAALFAVHPLHVESVAWVTERKDVLSTLFLMLALWAYAVYAQRPSWRRYLALVACFVASLMAKPMLVTFPVVLLFLDLWPLDRLRHRERSGSAGRPGAAPRTWQWLVVEKIPLILLSGASSVVTFLAQRQAGAVANIASVGPMLRMANALVAYVSYLLQTVWPVGLVAFYPYPEVIRPWAAGGALLLLSAVSVAVLRSIRSHPAPAVGWLWYLVTLLPVVGLVQVGNQGMADRFTYVPLIGVFIVVAWGVPALVPAGRWWRSIVAAAIVVALAVLARGQVETWRDDTTLWQHALDVIPDNFLAHNFVGRSLWTQGRADEAVVHFAEAVRLNPRFPDSRNNLGLALARQGRLDEAINEYRAAIRLDPGKGEALNNLGAALGQQGRFDEALAVGLDHLRLNPGSAEAHYNVGLTLARMGRPGEAASHYAEAARLRPDFGAAQAGLGESLAQQGQWAPAIAVLEAALRRNPGQVQLRHRLGALLVGQGRLDDAVTQYTEALRLEPGRADIHDDLGFTLAARGQPLDAIPHFVEAVRLAPGYALAHYHLGLALAGTGRFDEASGHFAEALRLDPSNAGAQRALASLPPRRRPANPVRLR
jgi:tetratricopeptide (TPR) repeat protein